MTETRVQCEASNVMALLLMLVFHGAVLLLKPTGATIKRVCVAAIVAAGVNVIAVRGIVFLTIMHQIMGMMAAEAAVSALRGPLLVVTTCAEAMLVLAIFVANFAIVVGEVAVAWRPFQSGLGLYPVVFGDAGLNHFARMPFYQKQHAVLHFFLSVLTASIATSLKPQWRRSHTVQQARIILEPACIVGVALILFTHHHGTGSPDLASHPAIGTLICLCAASQVVSYAAHVAAAPTAEVDVTAVLPRGSSPVVRLAKTLNAYTFLVLAYFLYIDSYMEYLGCRFGLLKPHATEGETRLGLDSGTELSTYLGFSVVGAALALACLLARSPHGATDPRDDPEDSDHLVKHALLDGVKDVQQLDNEDAMTSLGTSSRSSSPHV